jgi:endonuclease I
MYCKILKTAGLFVAVLLSIDLMGQIPDGYYDNAKGKSGKELKTALYNIIKGHVEFPYTASTTDVWDIIKETDRDTNNPANVILLYSGLSVDGAQEYNNGNGWTREHVWAKVHGDFGTDPGPGTDLHHLRPENDEVNNARNSRWFAECTTPYFSNGVNTGCFTSSTQWVWKPRKEVIGDVARMIFYMATRYEGENGEPDLELIDYLPADNNSKEPLFAKLSDLVAWNAQDPVDDFERHRNEVIFSYQKNRNPFIDHPEYVNLIWGSSADKPVFTSTVDSTAVVGELYQYHVTVTDKNPSSLVISLTAGPGWLSLASTGEGAATLSGTPQAEDVGDFLVSLKASNGQTESSQQFYLNVSTGSYVNDQITVTNYFYPNPADDFVNLVDAQNVKCIYIYNVIGQPVFRAGNPIQKICIDNLPDGLYFIYINHVNGLFDDKLLIQH